MGSTPAIADSRTLVDHLLLDACQRRASDLHIEPGADGFEIRLRIDGILQMDRTIETSLGKSIVARLMVMAKLLTYRMDVPQEGRISLELPDPIELRVAVMPTIHGMRAAVRMPADRVQSAVLAELGLPAGVQNKLQKFAASDSGMLILTGPAGSGKTTTIYAILAEIMRANKGGISIIALEDPVERSLPGITQIEVAPFGQLTYERALRSILRQDPQVLMLGEIRDAAVASLAVQAALSGHRLVTTLHAATVGMAVARLLEMGVERYQVTSSLWAVVNQRLVRRKSLDGGLGGSSGGYSGRAPVAECAMMDAAMRKIVLESGDANALDRAATAQTEYRSLAQVGSDMVEAGITDQAEISRVLGEKRG